MSPANSSPAKHGENEMATKKVEKLAIDGGKKVWTKGFPAWAMSK